MKKFTILFSILLFAFFAQAQSTWKGEQLTYTPEEFVLKPSRAELAGIQDRIKTQRFDANIEKAVDCPVDTSLFPLLKSSTLGIDGYSNTTNRFSGALQRYLLGADETATVNGFDFHAFFVFDSTNTAVISTVVDCNIFPVNFTTGGPDRTNLLGTVQVTVDTTGTNRSDGFLTLNDTRYSATFPTPVQVTDAFFLEVAISSTTDLIGIFRNNIEVNSVAGDGGEDNDGWYVLVQDTGPVTAPGPAITGTNGNGEPIAWDSDNLLHPHIEISINPDFNLTDGTCLAHGEAAVFANESSTLTGNRYFNVFAALSELEGAPDSTYLWFADTLDQMTATNWGTKDLVTVYAAPKTTAVPALEIFELGYSRLCRDGVAKQYDAGPLANADFSFELDTNMTVTFTNNSTGAAFEWDFGDGNTSTEIVPTHTYATTGLYTVTLVAGHPAKALGNCTDTLSLDIGIYNTSIQDDLLNSQVKVFPNPSNGLIQVKFNLDQVETVRAELRNMIGQRVFELSPRPMQIGEVQMDLRDQEAGLYLLTLWADDRQITRKISLK